MAQAGFSFFIFDVMGGEGFRKNNNTETYIKVYI